MKLWKFLFSIPSRLPWLHSNTALTVGYESFYICGHSDISYTYTLLFLDHPVGTISFGSNDSEIEGVTEQVSCLICG